MAEWLEIPGSTTVLVDNASTTVETITVYDKTEVIVDNPVTEYVVLQPIIGSGGGGSGTPGADGDSAYEIAVDNGFVGSESEWLESLKGDPGDDGAPGTTSWSGITDKPSTFTPSTHNHDDRYYTEAETDSLLGGKQAAGDYATNSALTSGLAGKANASHTHTASQITDFNTSVDSRIENIIGTAPANLDTLGEIADALNDDASFAATITTALSGKSDTGHTHTIGNITSLQSSLDAKVPTSRTINSKPLSSNVTLTPDDFTDGTTNKVYSATEKTKLSGIATGATANDTDANLKNRANHTGSQAKSTISDLISNETIQDLLSEITITEGATPPSAGVWLVIPA